MPPLPSVLPMTAMTRSASITPSSMSLANSEASLTLCSGTLRTSIGAGTGFPSRSADEDGAGLVAGAGVGDVFQGRDDGARAAVVEKSEHGVHLRAHAAARELAGCGVLAELRGGHPPQRAGVGSAEVDHDVGD